MPVWLRDTHALASWGNRAFLIATGVADVDAVIAQQPSLEKSERDLASAARAEGAATEAKRFTVVGGQRRALAFTHVPLPTEGLVVGTAIDVTDIASAEARLQQHIDASSDTLDKLATAVAIFDRDQKLSFHNRAFSQLWGLPESWLERRPTDGEMLDRLRERAQIAGAARLSGVEARTPRALRSAGRISQEELWHVPGGKTLRVVPQPHPFGGLTFLYEDVTEKLSLESSYNTLIKVQSATLDTLTEAVAVFGPDARLKLHNAAFARIWELEPERSRRRAACAEDRGGLQPPLRRRGRVEEAGRAHHLGRRTQAGSGARSNAATRRSSPSRSHRSPTAQHWPPSPT